MRRPLRIRLCAAVASLVLIGGCAPSDPATPPPSAADSTLPSPAVPSATPSGPVAVAPSTAPPSVAAGLELSEVRFSPLPGDPQFVEIANARPAAVPLAGIALRLDALPLPVASADATLGPGERLLVVLDGPKDPEPHQVHAAGALGTTAGTVQLVDPAGKLLDVVRWGARQPNAVSLSGGDFGSDEVAPGTTIGRPPGAADPFLPTDWVTYPPASATPGDANPVPRVAVLLPMDGAIVDARSTLAWYPVTGAASYRVQVATENSLASPVVDTTVSEPQIGIASLAAGRYVWRVQAIGADGAAGTMSDPNGFELGAGVAQIAPAVFRPGAPAPAAPPAVDAAGKQLPVPVLLQRKDTSMLLLEEPHEHAPMAWDAAHDPPNGADPADNKNCAVTMVAMVNHFYGGDLSEDRIGYQVLKDRQPGPEQDLVFGAGLSIPQTNAAFAFALGQDVTFVPEYASYDEAWAAITTAIDAGRPVPGANTHHGFVITGYSIRADGHRIVSLNDPAYGRTQTDLDGAARSSSTDLSLWLLPDSPTGTKQETSVTTDSDGDGVVDFDETERFHTNPNDVDTDADKVHDKQDIASGVFDAEHGYAAHREDGGRDWDGDALATERDPDSDNGGCQDGDEDKDVDGHRNGTETWNFDVSDDACFDLVGTITYDRVSTNDAGNGEGADATLHATIDVKLKVDPNDPTHLIDAGSSYTVDNVFTSQRPNGSDCSPARHISRSKGTYRFSDPPIPSPGHTLEQLGVDANTHPDIWAYLDRQRGAMGIAIIPWFPENVEDTCQLFSSPLALPIVIDDWVCGSDFSGLNLSIDAKIGEAASGPLPVTVDCHQEGPAFLWQSQKITAKGELKLVAH